MVSALETLVSRRRLTAALPSSPTAAPASPLLETGLALFCSFPLVTPSAGSSLQLVEQLCDVGLGVVLKVIQANSDSSAERLATGGGNLSLKWVTCHSLIWCLKSKSKSRTLVFVVH